MAEVGLCPPTNEVQEFRPERVGCSFQGACHNIGCIGVRRNLMALACCFHMSPSHKSDFREAMLAAT